MAASNAWSLANGKDLLLSRSFWGVVLAVVGMLLKSFGYAFKLDDPDLVDQIMAVVAILLQVAGPLLALWGTITRKGPITSISGIKVASVAVSGGMLLCFATVCQAAEGDGLGAAAVGTLDWLKEFIGTPLGMAVAAALLAIVSKRFPVIGNLLTTLFDKFFRPVDAPPPPNVVTIDAPAVEGSDCAAAAESLQFLSDHLQTNGMPEPKLKAFIADAAPYLICTDHSAE
jgi:hypothetical protein